MSKNRRERDFLLDIEDAILDLFTHAMNDRMKSEVPLATRKRPRTLYEYIGMRNRVAPSTSSAPASC